MKKIRKAVFPVAGLGTRFLPATKAIPKEMLTVVDRPVIQYVVDEAREAGIEHFIFVTGRNKAVIEDHFDIQFELYNTLAQRGKDQELGKLQRLQPAPGQTSFTRQQVPLGLGHAVWCARDLVGDEPFALLLPDMIMQSDKSCMKDMVSVYERDRRQRHRGAGMRSGRDAQIRHRRPRQICRRRFRDHLYGRKAAARHCAVQPLHQWPLHPAAGDFQDSETQERGAGNEIQLTDGMLTLAKSQGFHGYHYRGETYDCGSPEGFIEANIAFGLARADVSDKVAAAIDRLYRPSAMLKRG
jgi:UTP--glucose-1-phosphate uridylyltransferase